jgi:tryptophanyl-tRNA synthetase
MAADILLYDTNLVPVGADQKQHIELTRDLALRMNHLYGENLLTVPEPYIPPVGARIMSLQNPEIKMSKSDPDPMGAVYLMDSDDTILKKLKKAVTDSGTEITDSDEKPGIRNLLSIQSALTGKPIRDLVESYRGKMYGHLKLETAEHVIAVLGPLRKRATAYLQDRGELDQILRAGAERARIRAERKLKLIQEQIGLLKS